MWGYICQNGRIGMLGFVLTYGGVFEVWGFWGKKKVQKKGVFWGVQNGGPASRGAITLSNQRKMGFSRVYRGFFLSGNRLAVVLSFEKIFLGGFLGGF